MIGTKVFSRWLKKLSQPTRPIRRTSKLGMEVLEARDVPANFNVTSIADTNTVGTLRWAINQADGSADNTITITPTATGQLTLTANLPTITQPMTITDSSGGKFSVSGADTYQIFVIAAPTTLNNLKLTKGASGGNGGAVDVTTTAALTMNSCSVTYSTASAFGGGLYSQGGGVVIQNSTFDHNSVTGGGVGGAIEAFSGDVSLSNSTVSFNKANTVGGANANNGNFRIYDHTTVTSNSATAANVGGIGANGNLSITSSIVNSNKAVGVGGGIYSSVGSVKVTAGSEVDNNSAGSNGGGIWHTGGGNVSVTGSEVSGNTSKKSGGGIFTAGGSVTVNHSTFDYNHATGGSGGAIWAGANVTVNGSKSVTANGVHTHEALVFDNSASANGGGIYSSGGSVTVNAIAHVEYNSAAAGAGGGIWASGNVNVNGSTSNTANGHHTHTGSVYGNNASTNGGGIYSSAGSVTINEHGTVNTNTATTGDGGGIDVAGGNVTLISSASVDGNTAGGNGGGINANSNGNGYVVLYYSSSVNGNTATGNGGGINQVSGDVDVYFSSTVGTTLSGGANTAGGTGGGINDVSGNVLAYYGSSVDGNTATGNGGGINDAAGNVQISYGASADSNTGANGGGINDVAGNVGVAYASVHGNHANSNGGGINDFVGNVTAGSSASIAGNKASQNGGGIYVTTGKVVVNNGGSVQTNTAAAGSGGGVYVAGGNVTLQYGGSVSSNLASAHGGGILVGAGNVTVQHESAVSDNHAMGAGGGIWEAATASTKGVNVTSSTVAGNGSGSSGGGIFISQGSATILNSTLSGNTAAGTYGGGIVGEDSKGTITVTQSTISGNSAGTYGGGIASGNTATINNSTIVLNSVGNSGAGGGVAALGAITINNTIVAGNFAGTTATPADVVGTATGSNNVIGNAATAGGLKDKTVDPSHANSVGINGSGTRPVNTIVNPALTNNGGPTLTHALEFASVADGNGNSTLNPGSVGSVDQRGFPRTINSLMDVGAVQGTTSFGAVVTVGNIVKVFAPDNSGTLLATLTPFGSAVKSVRVAVGDVTGDGVPDLVVAAGAGGGQIAVYDGTTAKVVKTLSPYGQGYTAGLYVAVGNVVAGKEDIVVGPGGPAEPVEVIDSVTGLPVKGYTFIPFPQKFPGAKYSGGVRVAAGDVFGEGHDQVIVGSGSPQVAYVEIWDFNGTKMVPLKQFAPAGITGNGLYLAAADLNGDGYAEIIIGSGVVSGSNKSTLRVFDFHDSKVYGLPNGTTVFSNASNSEEVRVAARNVDGRRDANGNLLNEVVVATGAGPTQQVRVFEATGNSLVLLETLTPAELGLPAKYAAGMYVA